MATCKTLKRNQYSKSYSKRKKCRYKFRSGTKTKQYTRGDYSRL